jgi:hypothetical protein
MIVVVVTAVCLCLAVYYSIVAYRIKSPQRACESAPITAHKGKVSVEL